MINDALRRLGDQCWSDNESQHNDAQWYGSIFDIFDIAAQIDCFQEWHRRQLGCFLFYRRRQQFVVRRRAHLLQLQQIKQFIADFRKMLSNYFCRLFVRNPLPQPHHFQHRRCNVEAHNGSQRAYERPEQSGTDTSAEPSKMLKNNHQDIERHQYCSSEQQTLQELVLIVFADEGIQFVQYVVSRRHEIKFLK